MRNPDLHLFSRLHALPRHSRTLLLLVLAAFGLPLCATAMAQQAPLTGQMLDGQTAVAAPPPATSAPIPTATTTATPVAAAHAPVAATTAPAQATPAARQNYARWYPQPTAAGATRASVARPAATPAAAPEAASPATVVAAEQSPMPAYTNLDTSLADTHPPTTTTRRAAFGTPIGGATQHLLHMQASNAHVSNNLTTLGPEATAAWKRYLASFNYPIPKFLKQTVKSSSGGGQ